MHDHESAEVWFRLSDSQNSIHKNLSCNDIRGVPLNLSDIIRILFWRIYIITYRVAVVHALHNVHYVMAGCEYKN